MVDERRKVSELALLLLLIVSGLDVLAQSSPSDALQQYYEAGEKALAENRYGDAEWAYE
jgi:hypothetical protein